MNELKPLSEERREYFREIVERPYIGLFDPLGVLASTAHAVREVWQSEAYYREKYEEAARQLEQAQSNNRARNLELDALHYVWCDGGCKGGIHRFGVHPELTADIVAAAERNTRRLRSWYVNQSGNQAPPTVEDRIPVWRRAHADVYLAQIAQLEAENVGLRVLSEWARHQSDCAVVYPPTGMQCTCGYNDAILAFDQKETTRP